MKFLLGLLQIFFILSFTAQAAPMELSQESPPTEEEKFVAQGMESMFVNLMIREMRKSVPENEFIPPSQAEKIYTEMLDQEYSQRITEHGSVGFAELILAQIRGKR